MFTTIKILFLFLIIPFTIFGQNLSILNQNLVFFSHQNKIINIQSKNISYIKISLYKIKNTKSFVHRFIQNNYTLDNLIIPTHSTYRTKLSQWFANTTYLDHSKNLNLTKIAFFSQKIKHYRDSIFLPIKDIGFYILLIEANTKITISLILISDLSIFVSQDSDKYIFTAINKETGRSTQADITIYSHLLKNNKIKKHTYTIKKNHPLIIKKRSVEPFTDVVAQFSNSFAYKKINVYTPPQKKIYNIITIPDKTYYYNTNRITLYSFFYKRDKYNDYNGVTDDTYSLIINKKTNQYSIQDNFYHIVQIPAQTFPTSGRYPIITLFHNQRYTNQIVILPQNEKKQIIHISSKKQIYFLGEPVSGKIEVKNFGFRTLNNIGIQYIFLTKQNGTNTILKQTKFKYGKGIRKFSLHTKHFSKKNYVLHLIVKVKNSDGKILNTYKNFFIYNSKEQISLKTKKDIFLSNESIQGTVFCKNILNPFETKKMKLTVSPYRSLTILTQIIFSTKKEATNFNLNISYLGPITLTLKSLTTSAIYRKHIWIASYASDIHFKNYKVDSFKIIMDKPFYYSGDIARALILSKYKNIHALFQIKQDKIISSQIIQFPFYSQLIDIPISDDYKPSINLSIFTIFSNKIKSTQLDVNIPLANKLIKYDFQTTESESNIKVSIISKNSWDRPIKTLGLFSLHGNNLFFSSDRINLFDQFYNENLDNYFPQYVTIDNYNIFDNTPIFPSYHFTYNITNIFILSKKEFSHQNHIWIQSKNLTKDGKIYSTNFKIPLGTSLKYYCTYPKQLFLEDKSSFSILIQNDETIQKKYLMKIQEITKKKFIIITNRLSVLPQSFSLLTAPIIPTPPLSIDHSVITYENQINEHYTISKRTSILTNLNYPTFIKVSKKYQKKLFRFNGHIYFKPTKQYQSENIVKVQIHIKKLQVNSLPIQITDTIPSGFKFVGFESSDRYTTQYTNNRVIFSTYPLSQKKMTVQYFLKAETPGQYIILPPVIKQGNQILMSKKQKKNYFIYIKF